MRGLAVGYGLSTKSSYVLMEMFADRDAMRPIEVRNKLAADSRQPRT